MHFRLGLFRTEGFLGSLRGDLNLRCRLLGSLRGGLNPRLGLFRAEGLLGSLRRFHRFALGLCQHFGGLRARRAFDLRRRWHRLRFRRCLRARRFFRDQIHGRRVHGRRAAWFGRRRVHDRRRRRRVHRDPVARDAPEPFRLVRRGVGEDFACEGFGPLLGGGVDGVVVANELARDHGGVQLGVPAVHVGARVDDRASRAGAGRGVFLTAVVAAVGNRGDRQLGDGRRGGRRGGVRRRGRRRRGGRRRRFRRRERRRRRRLRVRGVVVVRVRGPVPPRTRADFTRRVPVPVTHRRHGVVQGLKAAVSGQMLLDERPSRAREHIRRVSVFRGRRAEESAFAVVVSEIQRPVRRRRRVPELLEV